LGGEEQNAKVRDLRKGGQTHDRRRKQDLEIGAGGRNPTDGKSKEKQHSSSRKEHDTYESKRNKKDYRRWTHSMVGFLLYLRAMTR